MTVRLAHAERPEQAHGVNMADALENEEIAIRAHDIVVCMERKRSDEFDALSTLGLAVRLALHLRGAPPVPWDLLKKVAVHILNFATSEVRPAVELLAEAEFVLLDTEGSTIKTVISQVPYFDDLYANLGEVGMASKLTEAEQLALDIVHRLGRAPMLRDHVYGQGVEKQLADLVLDVGKQAGFLVERRARGRNVLLSPSNYSENDAAYADLVAGAGCQRVSKVVALLRQHQGWPLAKLEETGELGGVRLDADELAVVRQLAGDGFVPPPAIKTTHAGTNHFLFGPPPAHSRLPLHKKSIYERAMALVAAVRQGQLLPARHAIRSPVALLTALKDRGSIGATSESWEQYRQVAEMRVGRLVQENAGFARLELLAEAQENVEAVEMAISLVRGPNELPPRVDEQGVLALRDGHSYLEALVGRKALVDEQVVTLAPEVQAEIDRLLLGGFK